MPKGGSEILPRRLRGRGGASVVRREAAMNRKEDLDVKVREAKIHEEAIGCIIGGGWCGCKA
jgi:hypothetical protein